LGLPIAIRLKVRSLELVRNYQVGMTSPHTINRYSRPIPAQIGKRLRLVDKDILSKVRLHPDRKA
jgi:hypothetical protein